MITYIKINGCKCLIRNCSLYHYGMSDHPDRGTTYFFETLVTNYVPNTIIQKDLQIRTVKHEIRRQSYHYSKRLSVHPNELILNLKEPTERRRLRKNLPIYLPTRFNT
jgi:hypothetical protein